MRDTAQVANRPALPNPSSRGASLLLVILIVALPAFSGCWPDATPTFTVDPVPVSDTRPAPEARSTPTVTRSPVDTARVPGPTTVPPGPVTHGDRSQPYVALTFDACQTEGELAGYDASIIHILEATHTPATLFLGGLWMGSHPTQTRALAANPLFELGNHSWSHPDFARLEPEEMSREIQRTQAIMLTLTGRQPSLFRFPFDTYTQEALAVVGQHGLRTVQADVLTGDADPGVTAGDIIDAVTGQAQNGSIILMHVNGRGWHTAEALPTVIERLRADGYTLVTVSELLEQSPESE